jgi:hypothetical protein
LKDPKLNAAIAQAWIEAFGALQTPKQYAASLIDHMQSQLNELRQFFEEVA